MILDALLRPVSAKPNSAFAISGGDLDLSPSRQSWGILVELSQASVFL